MKKLCNDTSRKNVYSESLLMCLNAFRRWMLKMDQCLYKFRHPTKHPIVPLLMKRIIAVKLHRRDMLQFRAQMNRLWRNMCSQQVSTMLRGSECPTNDPLGIRHQAEYSCFLAFIHSSINTFQVFSSNNDAMQDAPLP